jgi:hypothetical protein
MEEFAASTGVSWGRVQRSPVGFATPEGPRMFHQTFVLSLEGPPYIELLAQVPGSVWEKTGLSRHRPARPLGERARGPGRLSGGGGPGGRPRSQEDASVEVSVVLPPATL